MEELKIIGRSLYVKKMLDFIKKVSKTDSNILLMGETGVGKGLAAKKIHSLSKKSERPFIKLS